MTTRFWQDGYCLVPAMLDKDLLRMLRAGIALSAAFIVVRGLNGYGHPAPWRAFASPGAPAW